MRIAKLHIHNFRVYGSDVKLTLNVSTASGRGGWTQRFESRRSSRRCCGASMASSWPTWMRRADDPQRGVGIPPFEKGV